MGYDPQQLSCKQITSPSFGCHLLFCHGDARLDCPILDDLAEGSEFARSCPVCA
jgi:hypothetical protein